RGGAAEPGVNLDVGELCQPGQRVRIVTEGGDQRFLLALSPDANRLHKWQGVWVVFLVKALAGDAVGETAQGDGSVAQVREDVGAHLQVVADQVPFGVPALRPEDFFQVGELDAGRCAASVKPPPQCPMYWRRPPPSYTPSSTAPKVFARAPRPRVNPPTTASIRCVTLILSQLFARSPGR